MKQFINHILLFLLLLVFSSDASSQESQSFGSLWQIQLTPEIYPTPKSVSYENNFVEIVTNLKNKRLAIIATSSSEQKAARVFNRQMHLSGIQYFDIFESMDAIPDTITAILIFKNDAKSETQKAQAYTIQFSEKSGKNIIDASGYDVVGCIYAATSVAQLVTRKDEQTLIRKAQVSDYPDYSQRIFHGLVKPKNLSATLDWMVRYKMEGLVIDNRNYSWWKLDEELENILTEFQKWNNEFGGVQLMQPHNIYQTRDIEISNTQHRANLKNVIKTGLEHGVSRVMILADDTPPFEFGEGYILTSDQDKAQFKHMAEAHCFLMSELKEYIDDLGIECEIYYVPPFYTYEEMHYGDMSLYLNTPWEQQAFGPLERDLNYIGKNLPPDIPIIWSGPWVRSREITDEDLTKWTKNLSGRVPYLWDNTIYSHYPFTSSAMLTAFDNKFPKDFNKKTAGNGMFINGNIADELNRSSAMTVNDFLWNSKAYQADQSLIKAIGNLYGIPAVEPLLAYRDVELEIRALMGSKKIWSEADTLWQKIRDIRFVTQKNPFYYHLNYSRMKALRLQIKNSVQEDLIFDAEEYQRTLISLDKNRKSLILSIEKNNNMNLNKALNENCVKIE
jgi:hypothetical protein